MIYFIICWAYNYMVYKNNRMQSNILYIYENRMKQNKIIQQRFIKTSMIKFNKIKVKIYLYL